MKPGVALPENVNMLWSTLAVEACIRNGIVQFVISPGSRSTPLTIAAARNPAARITRAYDERGAAFWALGYARATGKPAVLISTSGTAVANYLPAVIEASQEGIPLLVFTADRPPELRDSGANQTIHQPGIFKGYTRWEFDMPSPSADVAAAFVLTTVEQAIFRTRSPEPGPVHLNWMFREPLAPVKPESLPPALLTFWKDWSAQAAPFTEYRAAHLVPDRDAIRQIKKRLLAARNGLLVVGGLRNAAERAAALRLAMHLAWPVYADVRSGLAVHHLPHGFRYLDLVLADEPWRQSYQPDVILHLGMPVTSKRYLQWVAAQPALEYIHIAPLPRRLDPNHQVRLRIWAGIPETIQALTYTMLPVSHPPVINQLPLLHKTVARTITEALQEKGDYNEIGVIATLSANLPENVAVFLGNSLPIRLWDWFSEDHATLRPIYANRGASGIDGLIATACGVAAGEEKTVVAIIGDISALHDLNSFLHVKESAFPVILVILNNSGGGIFRWLPVAEVKDSFETYFVTPHTLHFRDAARMFQIPYHAPRTISGFKQTLKKALATNRSTIIEIRTQSQKTWDVYQHIIKHIRHAIQSISN